MLDCENYRIIAFIRSHAGKSILCVCNLSRYAQHVAGTGARYTRANPPRRLLARFACPNQSEAGRLEAAIKRL